MARAWWVVVGGAVLAPLVTWLPVLTALHPSVPLPRYPLDTGISMWEAQVYWLVFLGILALVVGRRDRWLGWAVALAAFTIFLRGGAMDPTHSLLFAMGALGLVVMRQTPRQWHPRIATLLAAVGIFEVGYVWSQVFGYDLLWGNLWGLPLRSELQRIGTLGTVDGVGALIGMTAPLMPLWVVPLAVGAVYAGHSLTALLGLAVGLALRYVRTGWQGAVLIATGALAFGSMVWIKGLHNATTRVVIWAFGLKQVAVTSPIAGWGLGGWAQQIPARQVQLQVFPTPELWQQAHNEYLQWGVETGLVGLVILACWLWAHRLMFLETVWGPSVGALAVNGLGFFPFHVVSLALVGLIVVGLATQEEAT